MRTTGRKVALVLFNIKLILLIELFLPYFQSFAVQAAVALQSWGSSHEPRLLWFLAEASGLEPRLLTFFVIAHFASDAKEAIRLFSLRFLAHYLRWWLGMLLREPRPFWLSDTVEMEHCPVSYGLPSGHTIISFAVFVPLLWREDSGIVPKVLFFIWLVVLCCGRVYLGTHSPHDLLLGASLALCLVYVFDEDTIETMARKLSLRNDRTLICLAFLIGGVLNSLIWSFIMDATENASILEVYEARATANHCSKLSVTSPREGISAIAAYSGVLFAVALRCTVYATWHIRMLSSVMYLLGKVFLDLPDGAESIIIASVVFMATTYVLFEQHVPITRPLGRELKAERAYYGSVPPLERF